MPSPNTQDPPQRYCVICKEKTHEGWIQEHDSQEKKWSEPAGLFHECIEEQTEIWEPIYTQQEEVRLHIYALWHYYYMVMLSL